MSASELDHNGKLRVSADPLTLSSDAAEQKALCALGALSPTHLEKQPVATGTISPPPQPQEIVKVQFVQSGGKVIPLKSGSPKESPDGVTETPRKAKKKLSNFKLTFGKAGKSKNTKAPLSKHQTFSDDEGGFDTNDDDTVEQNDNDNENDPLDGTRSSWQDVDTAIPVLQL